MSSDGRWSGGLMNREWQRGTRPHRGVDAGQVTAYVKTYLADCKRFSLVPSEEMALKVVFHAGHDQLVRDAFRQLTGAIR